MPSLLPPSPGKIHARGHPREVEMFRLGMKFGSGSTVHTWENDLVVADKVPVRGYPSPIQQERLAKKKAPRTDRS